MAVRLLSIGLLISSSVALAQSQTVQPKSVPADPNRKPLFYQITESVQSQQDRESAKLDSALKNMEKSMGKLGEAMQNPETAAALAGGNGAGTAPTADNGGANRQPASNPQLLRSLTPEELAAARQLQEQLQKATESLKEEQKLLDQ